MVRIEMSFMETLYPNWYQKILGDAEKPIKPKNWEAKPCCLGSIEKLILEQYVLFSG